MTKEAAAIRTAAAANRMPLCMTPPGRRANPDRRITRTGPLPGCTRTIVYAGAAFKNRKGTAKTVLPGVLLDCNAVVHLIDTQNLGFPAIASELVVLAHDQRLDRLGRADFGAQTAEAAAREIEVEVVEHLDLRPRLAVSAERDEIVGTRLGALIADDACLRAGPRFGLEPEHAAEARRCRTPFGRILEGERRLRRVLQRDPQPFDEVDEEDGLEERDDAIHTRSPMMTGSD